MDVHLTAQLPVSAILGKLLPPPTPTVFSIRIIGIARVAGVMALPPDGTTWMVNWQRTMNYKINYQDKEIFMSNLMMVLDTGRSVPEPLYNSIKQHLEEQIPKLNRERTYKAEMLCGNEFWDSLHAGEQKKAGECIASMARQNILPLELVKTKHEYPYWYGIK